MPLFFLESSKSLPSGSRTTLSTPITVATQNTSTTTLVPPTTTTTTTLTPSTTSTQKPNTTTTTTSAPTTTPNSTTLAPTTLAPTTLAPTTLAPTTPSPNITTTALPPTPEPSPARSWDGPSFLGMIEINSYLKNIKVIFITCFYTFFLFIIFRWHGPSFWYCCSWICWIPILLFRTWWCLPYFVNIDNLIKL